jgi:hypothetical protein
MQGQRRSSLALSLWVGHQWDGDKDLVENREEASSTPTPMQLQLHAQMELPHLAC